MRDATRVVRAGRPPSAPGEPFLPGPTFAATYHVAGDPAQSPHTYGRFHNPTWTAFEKALGDLEGGSAVVFASGMAAVMAVISVSARPGDVVVLPSDSYYTIRRLMQGHLADLGVQVRMAPTTGSRKRSC